jgi:hypothetical protein
MQKSFIARLFCFQKVVFKEKIESGRLANNRRVKGNLSIMK